MKQSKFILFIFCLIIVGCQTKESPSKVKKSVSETQKSDIRIDIAVNDDMLAFKSMEDFKATYNYLEIQLDKHLAKYDEIEDSELEIDEQLPLVKFEKLKKFSSLRNEIENKIVKWLENTELDTINDPDDHFIEDDILRTLVNPKCRVLIGEKEYNLCDKAFMNDADNNNERTASSAPDCKLYLTEKKWCSYDGGGKKVKLKGTLRYYGVNSTLKAKVVSFKKKNNGNWKRHRTRLFVQSGGFQIDNSNGRCSSQYPVGSFKGPKNRKKLVTRYTRWGDRIWLLKNSVTIFSTAGNGQAACSFPLD